MKQHAWKLLPLQNIYFFSSWNPGIWNPSRIFPTSWAHYLLDLETVSQRSVCHTFDLKPSSWLFKSRLTLMWDQKLIMVSDFLVKRQFQVCKWNALVSLKDWLCAYPETCFKMVCAIFRMKNHPFLNKLFPHV